MQFRIRKTLLAGSVALAASMSVNTQAAIVHTADSESGSLREWPYRDGNPNTSQMCCASQSATYMSNDSANGGPASARAGSKFLRLSRGRSQALAPVAGHGNRVEVSAAGFLVDRHMQDRWLGVSVYIPSSFNTSVVKAHRWHSLMQWHDVGPQPGVLQVSFDGDNDITITSRNYNGSPPSNWWEHVNEINHYQMKMPRDRWVDFAYHIHWDHRPNSQGGQGRLQVWIDQQQVVDYRGPIGFGHSPGSNSSYFKMGSYAGEDNQFDRSFYFDEVRFGDGNSSLSEVSPPQAVQSKAEPSPPSISVQ